MKARVQRCLRPLRTRAVASTGRTHRLAGEVQRGRRPVDAALAQVFRAAGCPVSVCSNDVRDVISVYPLRLEPGYAGQRVKVRIVAVQFSDFPLFHGGNRQCVFVVDCARHLLSRHAQHARWRESRQNPPAFSTASPNRMLPQVSWAAAQPQPFHLSCGIPICPRADKFSGNGEPVVRMPCTAGRYPPCLHPRLDLFGKVGPLVTTLLD